MKAIPIAALVVFSAVSAGVRNMMPTRDGNLALACSGVNGIALAEIKSRGRS